MENLEKFDDKNSRYYWLKSILPHNTEVKNILDYGCGEGSTSLTLASIYQQAQVLGVEHDPETLIKARLNIGNTRVQFNHINDFNKEANSFDLVLSSQVLEHVHNPGNYIQVINNILRPNGTLIIGIPNGLTLRAILNLLFLSQKRAIGLSQKKVGSYDKTNDHIHSWDPIHFITFLASCGFELKALHSLEGIPLPFILKKIPLIGRFIPVYINMKIPLFYRLSYTNYYVFVKVKASSRKNED